MSRPTTRLHVVLATAAVALMSALVPLTSHAYDENSTAAVDVDAQGVGLHGYDPVAYFTVGAPTPGLASISAAWGGVTYHFANAADRDAFRADPARYAPQYGGFCAMGVALEKKFDGDPQAWKIVDGKLYLNVSLAVQKKWLEDVPGHLREAQENWPRIKDQTPKSLL